MASSPPQDSPTPPSSSSSSPPPQSSTPDPPPSSPPPSSPPPSSPTPPSQPPPNSLLPPPPKNGSPPPPTTGFPPSPNNGSPPPPTKNDDNSSTSPPPPPPSSNNNNSSPPPPPPKNEDDDGNNPPPSNNSSSSSRHSPPPPSLPSGSRDGSSNKSGSNSGLNIVPLIVGVGIGLAILLLLGLISYLCASKKKKKRLEYDYYAEKPSGGNGGNYFNSSPSPANNWQPTGNQKGTNLPPPPGAYGAWPSPSTPPPAAPTGGSQRPPPPGAMTSSDFSSNYSGTYKQPLPPPHPSVVLGFTQNSFRYDELAAATGNFSQSNLLGQGGFGYVHKGVLPNGKEIAVKSLKDGSGQGDREFKAEVEIISRVHHRHLVSLVGYCIAGGRRLLVYEFLPNSTLEFHLHGKGRPTMDWPTRVKIAVGSAKGLAYLHEDCHPRIIHRDIKAANILLDFNFEAKVADFGLAKLSTDNNTHVSTRVMGTFGYLAPEYASSGKLTDKSDVFSFGVMLLELITGRRPIDINSDLDDSLVDWARPICASAVEREDFTDLADRNLEGKYDPAEMARMVACAGAAVRHSGRRRPKMSQIVRALEGDMSLEHLNEGVKPGQSSVFNTSGYSDNETTSYSANMRKFRKMVMEGSQEYPSSEYGQTSEYGLNPSSSSSSGEDSSTIKSGITSIRHHS